jgi:hypothetical protein
MSDSKIDGFILPGCLDSLHIFHYTHKLCFIKAVAIGGLQNCGATNEFHRFSVFPIFAKQNERLFVMRKDRYDIYPVCRFGLCSKLFMLGRKRDV